MKLRRKVDGTTRRATVRVLLQMYPARTFVVVLLLLASGLAEAVGLVSILPLLGAVQDGTGSDSSLERAMTSAMGLIGLRPTLGTLLALVVAGMSAKALLLLVAMRHAGYAAIDVATELRLNLVSNLMNANWGFFTTRPVSALTNAVSVEAIKAGAIYSETCFMLAALIQSAIYALLSLALSWYLTLAAIVFGGLLFFAFGRFVKTARREGGEETATIISLVSRLGDTLAAIKPLKAMGRHRDVHRLIEADVRRLNAAQRRQIFSRVGTVALQEPLIAIMLAAGIFVSIRFLGGSFDQLVFMALMFHRLVTRLGNAQTFYRSVAELEDSFWSLKRTTREAAHAAERHTGRSKPTLFDSIQLHDVSFAYSSEPVLERVNVTIPAKKITAIIGPSGVGKTTLVDLIVGLSKPRSGRIVVDATPLEDLDLIEWRHRIGYVPQEMILLHDSILNNIAMGDPNVTTDDVERALRAAEAFEFVARLPEGLDTIVGERGVRLSGGQRQRLSIARALVHDPALLILDEPTTAVDRATEKAIFGTLRHLAQAMTILAISHQTSLIEAADVVFRLSPTDTGSARIAQTHHQL